MRKRCNILVLCSLIISILSGCSSSLYMQDQAVRDNKKVVSSREPSQKAPEEEAQPTIDQTALSLKDKWMATEKHLASLDKAENLDGVQFYYSETLLEKVIVSEGTYGETDLGYQREYYYDDMGLYFAELTKGNKRMRFYFQDGWLIRWIDEQGKAIDKPNDHEDFEMYDNALFQEADSLLQEFITEKSEKPENYSSDGKMILE